MIIIKIIILYFIQIRHTDDFPSTGTRLVLDNEWSVEIASTSREMTGQIAHVFH